MIVTDDTRALATAVVDYIEKHPDQHEQAVVWGTTYVDEDGETEYNEIGTSPPKDICGTVMCIAGTASYLHGGVKELTKTALSGNWEIESGALLGLNEREADSLFYTMSEELALKMTRAIADGDEDEFYNLIGC